jgi:antitoxin HigA-1
MTNRALEPSHAGEILKGLYLEPLSLTEDEAAKKLGVTQNTLKLILNGRQQINAEMAVRLSRVFKTTIELWLNLQRTYDLWHFRAMA